MTDQEWGELRATVEAQGKSYARLFTFTMTIVPIVVTICGGAVGYTYLSAQATEKKVEASESKILKKQGEDRKAAEGRASVFRQKHDSAAEERSEIKQSIGAARAESAVADSAIYDKLDEIRSGQTDILLELRSHPR